MLALLDELAVLDDAVGGGDGDLLLVDAEEERVEGRGQGGDDGGRGRQRAQVRVGLQRLQRGDDLGRLREQAAGRGQEVGVRLQGGVVGAQVVEELGDAGGAAGERKSVRENGKVGGGLRAGTYS